MVQGFSKCGTETLVMVGARSTCASYNQQLPRQCGVSQSGSSVPLKLSKSWFLFWFGFNP